MALPVLSAPYLPVPSADAQLYASIARARQLYGVGVPTLSWNSPAAVDHVPFYGPVFFDLAAASLNLFGVYLLSFRLISLAGAALYLLGTVILAREFSGSPEGPLLAAVLVLLSPEVDSGAASGAMHMLAIGFEVLALAVFAGRFDRRRSGAWRGLFAGLLVGAAALTTPRSYPFVAAFFCAGLVPAVFGSSAKAIWYRLTAAFVVVAAGFLVWTTLSHGGPAAWARYMFYIFTHEDTDVAILPTAVRTLSFHWSGVLTLAAVLVGSVVAAESVGTPGSGKAEGQRGALVFLLACTWMQLVATVVLLNYTFTIGEYILLPTFAVVVSWPRVRIRTPRRITAIAVALLLLADGALMARRYLYAAAALDVLDPAPMRKFFRDSVPIQSTVVGPDDPYFFPVEASGSRYRAISPRSWADWARWVPEFEPAATAVVRRFPDEPAGRRFLIWPDETPLPDGYQCAGPHLVGRYQPHPLAPGAHALMVRARRAVPGYPASSLYLLPAGCPVGYDPTRPVHR